MSLNIATPDVEKISLACWILYEYVRVELLPCHPPPVPVEPHGVAHLAVQEAVGQRDEETLDKNYHLLSFSNCKGFSETIYSSNIATRI